MRKIVRTSMAAVLALLAATASCVERRDPPLAFLGATVIRESDFQRHLKDVYPPEQVAAILQSSSERVEAVDEYLDSVAVLAKARRQGIDQEMRFKKAVELMELKLLAHHVSEQSRDRIVRDSRVSPAEVRSYYEEHKNELTVDPRFTARHLLVYVKGNPAFPEKGLSEPAARAKAREALAQLRGGKTWDAVAKAYSDDVGTSQNGGLLRDAQFGYFAPEVEQAVRTQELGKPGEIVKTVFGYHVIEVEERITERVPRPFDEVEAMLTERLSEKRSADAREAFMAPLRGEVGFQVFEPAKRDGFLLDDKAVSGAEVLAEIAGNKVLESDFQWFVKDALMPEQRASAYSRPGARQSMLASFLDMLVLEAKARKEGMHKTPDFVHERDAMVVRLLSEFMQERDKAGPFCKCGKTADELRLAQKEYFRQVRSDMGLAVATGDRRAMR